MTKESLLDSGPCAPESSKKFGLKPRQEAFCQAYVLDPNGTRAARRAGYSAHTARQLGSKLLTKVDIRDRIRVLHTQIAEHHCLDAASLMGKLEAVFHRAYENYQMHACVRVVGLQAQLAGAMLAKRDNCYPVIDVTPAAKKGDAASLKLIAATPPSTPKNDAVTLDED